MLLLGFIGVVLTDVLKDAAWTYWLYVVFLYAVFSLAFHLYSKGKEGQTTTYTFWHQCGIGSVFFYVSSA